MLDEIGHTDNGSFLNDILYPGFKLQIDIFCLLIIIRIFSMVLTADIRQMYRQINLIEDHNRFQRILWKFSSEKDKAYELVMVTFGFKSSPYSKTLALKTV